MARQWETGSVRRLQIVDAALSIMMNEGLGSLSIENIAKHVQVSPSAIYRHFSGREMIIDAVLQVLAERMDSFFTYADKNGTSPTNKLYVFFQLLLKNIFRKKIFPEAMLTPEFFQQSDIHRHTTLRLFHCIQTWVQQTVQEGQAAGSISKTIPADKFWVPIMGTVRSFIIMRELSPDELNPDKHGEEMWKMISKMLVPEE